MQNLDGLFVRLRASVEVQTVRVCVVLRRSFINSTVVRQFRVRRGRKSGRC